MNPLQIGEHMSLDRDRIVGVAAAERLVYNCTGWVVSVLLDCDAQWQPVYEWRSDDGADGRVPPEEAERRAYELKDSIEVALKMPSLPGVDIPDWADA